MLEVQKLNTLRGHEGAVYALEESPDTNKFFSGSGDRIVAEWDVSTMAPARALVNVGAIVYAICYVKEKNELLIGTSAGSIHVVDLTSRKEIRHIALEKGPIFSIRYSAAHQKIYASSGEGYLSALSL